MHQGCNRAEGLFFYVGKHIIGDFKAPSKTPRNLRLRVLTAYKK